MKEKNTRLVLVYPARNLDAIRHFIQQSLLRDMRSIAEQTRNTSVMYAAKVLKEKTT